MGLLGTLLLQRLRRDRWQLAMWILGTAALAGLTYVGVSDTYGTQQDRSVLLATAIANPVILLFRGLPSGADEGAFMLFLILPFLGMTAAFMSTFLAVRHTRTEEEEGRAELVGATPAGRMAPLAATVVHGVLANAVLAAATALTLIACGLAVQGSVISGVGAGAVGIAFLGIGLVAGQVQRTSRGANALSVWVLLITFLVAGIGNAAGTPSADLQRMESTWLVWLSPFGWVEQSRPFADDEWWPIVLCLAFGVVLAAAAFALQSARDFGAGIIPERRGRSSASGALSSPTALVVRLTSGAVLGWIVGGLITGLLATSLAGVLDDLTEQLPSVEAILASITASGGLAQGAVVIFFTMAGIFGACCAVQVVCHARQEEAHGTAEAVLSAPLDRVRWLADYMLVAFVAVILVIGAAVAGAALGLAASAGDWALLGDAMVSGAGQVVAASVFLVITALVFVLAPRLTIPLGWTLVVLGLVFGLFGPLFGLPEALVHLSPFASAPTVSPDGVDLRGFWWILGVVGVGAAGALVLMRRRELAPAG